MYVQAYVNQPISPAERLFEESTRVPYFSAQLALLTARPPEQNPRLAQGCVTFWAEHDRGPPIRVADIMQYLFLDVLIYVCFVLFVLLAETNTPLVVVMIIMSI